MIARLLWGTHPGRPGTDRAGSQNSGCVVGSSGGGQQAGGGRGKVGAGSQRQAGGGAGRAR